MNRYGDFPDKITTNMEIPDCRPGQSHGWAEMERERDDGPIPVTVFYCLNCNVHVQGLVRVWTPEEDAY